MKANELFAEVVGSLRSGVVPRVSDDVLKVIQARSGRYKTAVRQLETDTVVRLDYRHVAAWYLHGGMDFARLMVLETGVGAKLICPVTTAWDVVGPMFESVASVLNGVSEAVEVSEALMSVEIGFSGKLWVTPSGRAALNDYLDGAGFGVNALAKKAVRSQVSALGLDIEVE